MESREVRSPLETEQMRIPWCQVLPVAGLDDDVFGRRIVLRTNFGGRKEFNGETLWSGLKDGSLEVLGKG